MQRIILFLLLTFPFFSAAQSDSISAKVKDMDPYEGYFDFYWDEAKGKIWLVVDKFDQEFLYVNALSAGLGSNDIGLDRNQLGDSRVVKFIRTGPKVLLVQPNYDYRAVSENPDERQSVAEAFAQSVLWGFKAEAQAEGKALIDLTPFLLRDAHGVNQRLKNSKQGTYKIDVDRSVIHLDRTRNFPENSEFDALVTFKGEAQGAYLRSVTPTSESFSLRMHHSFIALPGPGFEMRPFDPRSGYNALSFQDYATPIDQPLTKRFILRHRLQKKDPGAAMSEAVEPIVYYLDRGAPEPIRSALLEGASWWNQAFEAAGYQNAFQVKLLPEGADPMDVRYNVINWVHRSTRGWSYGSSVTDPRTGEIIKGHVLLGSLRVRQDFLIAQGLVEAYAEGEDADPRLLEMALARLRQLSAHEVGHTLGLVHNFAASYNNRSSVMDYPHPYIELDENGEIDFSKAYDTGIGEWDKRTILYGYQDFPEGTDQKDALRKILEENNTMGLRFMADRDSRPPSGAHPLGHLWDNGKSAVEELDRLSELRQTALQRFSEKNIPVGIPMAELERVLVPLYLMTRYQVEAVSKVIGGVDYRYAVRGDGKTPAQAIPVEEQQAALEALLSTLEADFLALPEDLLRLLSPQPMGFSRGREYFKTHTGPTFDPIGAAESSVHHSLQFLLNPERLARIIEQHALDQSQLSVFELLDELFQQVDATDSGSGMEHELERMVEKQALQHLLLLAADKKASQQVVAAAIWKLNGLEKEYATARSSQPEAAAHIQYLLEQLRQWREDPDAFEAPALPSMPDGSPIGCSGPW